MKTIIKYFLIFLLLTLLTTCEDSLPFTIKRSVRITATCKGSFIINYTVGSHTYRLSKTEFWNFEYKATPDEYYAMNIIAKDSTQQVSISIDYSGGGSTYADKNDGIGFAHIEGKIK